MPYIQFSFIQRQPLYAQEPSKIIHKNVHVDVKRDLNCFVQNEIGQRKTGSFESQLRAFSPVLAHRDISCVEVAVFVVVCATAGCCCVFRFFVFLVFNYCVCFLFLLLVFNSKV